MISRLGVAVSISLVMGGVARADDGPPDAPQRTVLDNGLEVIVQRDANAQWAVVWLSYHVGSRDEDEPGIAHLTEHLSFRGTSKISGIEKVSLLQRRGGVSNAFVTPDETVYFAVVPPAELAVPLWIESDRMLYVHRGLDPQLVNDEAQVVEREYALRDARRAPSWIVARYPPRHPYRRALTEEPEAEHDLRDVADFMARHYRPDNATLVITGQVDPETAMKLVDRYFGDIRTSSPLAGRSPTPAVAYRSRETWMLGRLAPRSFIQMTWAIDCTHGDCLADLWLLRAALVSGDGPLYRDLMVEREAATSISAHIVARAAHQELTLEIGLVPSAVPKEVQTQVDHILRRYAGTPLDDLAFRALRTDAIAQWLVELQSPTTRARELSLRRDPDRPDALWDERRLRKRLETLDASDLAKTAARFAPPDRCLVVHANASFKRSYTTHQGSLGFAR